MKKIIYYALLCVIVTSVDACKSTTKNKGQAKAENLTMDTLDPIIIVSEEAIYDVPVPKTTEKEVVKPEKNTTHKTSDTHKAPEKKSSGKLPTAKVSHKALKHELAKTNITPAKTVDTAFFSFSAERVNEVQTLTSYEKNGTEILTIVSAPTDPDEIDYIVFTDKKNNTDVYGVKAGLTAKEVKNLRKDLKHFVKKGKIFLYTDDSNILYELDGVTSDGKPVTEDHIDDLEVSSIIWKDKAGKAMEE